MSETNMGESKINHRVSLPSSVLPLYQGCHNIVVLGNKKRLNPNLKPS